jgi:hypothetical protein
MAYVSRLREHELAVGQGLSFHLVVHNPFRALRGLRDMMAAHPSLHPLLGAAVDDMFSAARALVFAWLPSDVTLRFPPSQIALAALVQAAAKINPAVADALLAALTVDAPVPLDSLRSTLAAIQVRWTCVRVFCGFFV